MNTIQEIFRKHGGEYLAMYGDKMPERHKKVIKAVQECRTGECGIHVFECPECHEGHIANSSCGNRHCPVCQNDKAAKWVYKQQMRLLPCTYFMATFTLPEELRTVARANQRKVYKALFTQAAESLKQLEADPRFVGCKIAGFSGVLHTWSRQMDYHPHVHFVIPGGGLDGKKQEWQSASSDFLVHVKALSRLFRGKMKSAMTRAGLFGEIPEAAWYKEWVVHCKPVGSGRESMKYLGAYVFRVAISSSRITGYDGKQVTFKYQKVGSSKWRSLTLPVTEFMRRFLMHVLPTGFMKIRHYGFLSPNFSIPIQRIRELICVIFEFVKQTRKEESSKIKPLRCPKCNSLMKWIRFIRPMAIPVGT